MAVNTRLSEQVVIDAAEHSRWANRLEQQVYLLGEILATLNLPANRLLAKTSSVLYASKVDELAQMWYNRHKELLMTVDGYDIQTKNGENENVASDKNLPG